MNYDKLDSAALQHRLNNPEPEDDVKAIKAVLQKRGKLPADDAKAEKATKAPKTEKAPKAEKPVKEKVDKPVKEKVVKEKKPKAEKVERGKPLKLSTNPHPDVENNIGKTLSATAKNGSKITGVVTEIFYYANRPNLVYYMIKVGEAKPVMFSVSKIVW